MKSKRVDGRGGRLDESGSCQNAKALGIASIDAVPHNSNPKVITLSKEIPSSPATISTISRILEK